MAQRWVVAKNGVTVTASTAQTLLEFETQATTTVTIIEFGVSFNQFNAAQPVEVQWVTASAAITTPSAATAVAWQAGQGTSQAVPKVPGTENFTLSATYWNQQIPITSGYTEQFPYGRELIIPISTTSFRLHIIPGTTGGTCDFYVVWEE